jgi:hypothetical protein
MKLLKICGILISFLFGIAIGTTRLANLRRRDILPVESKLFAHAGLTQRRMKDSARNQQVVD